MKKTMLLMALGCFFGLSSVASAAVPVIDGLLGAGGDITEWANDPSYEYYLDISDVDEAGISASYDLERIILLQELGNGDSSKDGVYLMIKTYGTPSLTDVNAINVGATVALFADFNGDGVVSNAGGGYPADIQMIISNNGVSDTPAGDRIAVCFGAFGTCDAFNPTFTPIWIGGPTIFTPAGFLYDRDADAFELFFRTGTFGTPANTNFPFSFGGTIQYDDGTDNPDDTAFGTLVPEPSSVVLLGVGLLALAGYRRFRS